MGTKLERYEQISKGATPVGNYLFFDGELVIGNSLFESHKEIFALTDHRWEEVLVAGGFSVPSSDVIRIDGSGSQSLEIPSRDPEPVVEFIKHLPGAEGKIIEAK